MKKLILASIAATCALSAFSQGSVVFNNRVGGTSHVYAPLSPSDTTSVVGQGANDSPVGATAFGGRALIGATLGGQYGANTTLAQLLAANGAGQPESSLVPAGITVTFRTGTAAGGVAGANDTLSGSNVPKDAPAATLEMVAWDNSSGQYSNWTVASAAWMSGLIAAGKSGAFNLGPMGGDFTTAPNLEPGGISFNLYFQNVPEPSTFALGGLVIGALTIFRRRKQ